MSLFYNIGKNIYHSLRLDRFEVSRKIAALFVTCLMTEQYNLQLSLDNLASEQIDQNESFWIILKDVVLTSGSRLITQKNKNSENQAFLPSLQNDQLWQHLNIFKLQEEAQFKFKIKHIAQKVLLRPQNHTHTIEEMCFSALSPFSSSWVHWLCEILPQIIWLSKSSYKNTVKILIENNAPSQVYETIYAFFPTNNIIKLAPNARITCKNLLINKNITQGWSVVWGRNANDKLTETFNHDIEAIFAVRKAIYEHFNISDTAPQNNIFIRRRALFRFIHNEQEIADYLLTKQFGVIEPSTMNFREQVECFSNANVIVAQSGASLANIIFMKPGSTVICMAAQSTFLNYDYFLTLAKALGISFHYILGTIDNEKNYSYKHQLSITHPLNSSFTINKKDLENILKNKI